MKPFLHYLGDKFDYGRKHSNVRWFSSVSLEDISKLNIKLKIYQ